MSFYRSLLAAVAAVALATPVFAADDANTQTLADNTATTQSTDTSGAATSGDQSGTTGQATTETKVNLNKATAKELMKVKGLNASKAKSIVAYRKAHGDFKSVDELSNVKGFKKMKPEMLKDIEDQLTVE